MIEQLPIYEVRARNTSAESENKIHDNTVAARFGFSGGLVPGVTVLGYLTVPIVTRFPQWLEHGSMQVRFTQPFYDGDPVVVRARARTDGDHTSLDITAERRDGTVCASASATVDSRDRHDDPPAASAHPTLPMPSPDSRQPPTSEALVPGTALGTLVERLDLIDNQNHLLKQIGETLPVYFGESAVAHPVVIVGMANHILMRNVALGPWIHASSDLTNFSAASNGEEITVRGLIAEQFERKGHQFVVLDLVLYAGHRLVQQIRHTAIFRIRQP